MNAKPLIAIIAASATLLTPTVELQETHGTTIRNVSIQQVQFASLTTIPSPTAAPALSANTIGGGAILTGAKIGALAGFELTFLAVGSATISLLGWSPIIGGAISQLITLAASLVAVPVGAVLGAIGAVFKPPSAAGVEPKASSTKVIRGNTPWALPATARIKTGAAARTSAKANSLKSASATVGGKKHRPAVFPKTSVRSKAPHQVSPNRQTA